MNDATKDPASRIIRPLLTLYLIEIALALAWFLFYKHSGSYRTGVTATSVGAIGAACVAIGFATTLRPLGRPLALAFAVNVFSIGIAFAVAETALRQLAKDVNGTPLIV